MANLKRLTSFGVFNTGEGDRISFTFSVINPDTGEVIEQNKKGNFLVLDDGVQGHIDAVRSFIRSRYLEEEEE